MFRGNGITQTDNILEARTTNLRVVKSGFKVLVRAPKVRELIQLSVICFTRTVAFPVTILRHLNP